MLISSTGFFIIFLFSFLVPKAKASDIGPILPRYIVQIIMLFHQKSRPAVMPLVSPTVAVALTVS